MADRAPTFTPGPWRINQLNHVDGDLWLSIGHHTHEGTDEPEGRWIGPVADIQHLVTRESEQWANARLIACAPDLYAALEAARETLVALEKHSAFRHLAGAHEFIGTRLASIDAVLARVRGEQP
jgi:hypothetical protein